MVDRKLRRVGRHGSARNLVPCFAIVVHARMFNRVILQIVVIRLILLTVRFMNRFMPTFHCYLINSRNSGITPFTVRFAEL